MLGLPVVSVDCKKKELIGEFKNQGREWRPKGEPVPVNIHDFVSEQGKAIPYGIYDIGRNVRWVNVGLGSRNRRLCGREHPPLVARRRRASVSRRLPSLDLLGFGWRQRLPSPGLEA